MSSTATPNKVKLKRLGAVNRSNPDSKRFVLIGRFMIYVRIDK